MTPEQVDAWGKASRVASGKPLKIEDPAMLARLVTLAFADQHDCGGSTAAGATHRRHSKRPSDATRRAARKAGGADGSA